jgi:hypothetical protein
MERESARFKRRALRVTPEQERRLRCPLTTMLLDIRLPVAMQLAFEAGWKSALRRSLKTKKGRAK